MCSRDRLWWIPIVRRFFIFFFSVGAIFDFFIIIIIYSNPNNTPRRLRRFLSVVTRTNTHHMHTHTHYTIGPDARLYWLYYYIHIILYYYHYASIYTLPGARVFFFCFFGIVEIRLLATIIIIHLTPVSVSLYHHTHTHTSPYVHPSVRMSYNVISRYVDSSSDRSDIIIRL